MRLLGKTKILNNKIISFINIVNSVSISINKFVNTKRYIWCSSVLNVLTYTKHSQPSIQIHCRNFLQNQNVYSHIQPFLVEYHSENYATTIKVVMFKIKFEFAACFVYEPNDSCINKSCCKNHW